MNRVLVLFDSNLPNRSSVWWKQFAVLIAPKALASAAAERNLSFRALEDLADPGSIVEAAAFLKELATIEIPDGGRVSESISYRGFQLWWMNYDDLFLRQCLPYTQYRRLLDALREYRHVTLLRPPAALLFRSFLGAHGVPHAIEEGPRAAPALGIWIQVLISLLSWPILMLKRPRLLLYTGDLFDPPRDHSFRMRFIYEELRKRKIPFVEFIRSLEPGRVMLAHAFFRRRPVIYSYAIKVVTAWLLSSDVPAHPVFRSAVPEQSFKLALASTYAQNARAHRWSIRIMNWLVRSIGIRAAVIPAASSRTFHEVLGCRLSGIPTLGILHGAASKYYNVYDFMPEYRGKERLSLDRYGVWSAWWRDYYIANGRAYAPEQLFVSGPMRPMSVLSVPAEASKDGPIKVLFVPGELSVPQEVMNYIETLRRDPRISFFLTFRPYRDQFEEWLKQSNPRLLEELNAAGRIFRGRRIQEDIAECDVVVGSYSTAVLEALLQFKPLVFFNSNKWGDYFAMREYRNGRYFAENPEELLARIQESKLASLEELKDLQERFFGDPTKNGSAWLIDQAEQAMRSMII